LHIKKHKIDKTALIFAVVYILHKYKKTAVYINVNDDIVSYTSKTAKINKRWYYPATHHQMSTCCWVFFWYLRIFIHQANTIEKISNTDLQTKSNNSGTHKKHLISAVLDMQVGGCRP